MFFYDNISQLWGKKSNYPIDKIIFFRNIHPNDWNSHVSVEKGRLRAEMDRIGRTFLNWMRSVSLWSHLTMAVNNTASCWRLWWWWPGNGNAMEMQWKCNAIVFHWMQKSELVLGAMFCYCNIIIRVHRMRKLRLIII